MKCDVCKLETDEAKITIVPLTSKRLEGLRDKLCPVCAKRRGNAQLSRKLMKETGLCLKKYMRSVNA